VPRRHTVVIKPEVGVTDATTRDLDDDLARTGIFVPLREDHGLIGPVDDPSGNSHQIPSL
jgi:hypothetical protein